jgi:hypothetical protein
MSATTFGFFHMLFPTIILMFAYTQPRSSWYLHS